jgi:serine/threonine-protein kinase RIM15
MEFKLPQINGEDVARMIRTSKNPNSATPIVAVTGYLKDLSDPQHFDELMEKPATQKKLIDVLERLCFWKAPPPERNFGDRKESISHSKPPTISDQHGPVSPTVERFMTGERTSTPSLYSVADDDAVSITSSNWDLGLAGSGLNIEPGSLGTMLPPPPPVNISQQETTPVRLQSHAMERIPSPLSTHISAGMIESLSPPPLPSRSSMDLAPLPPSITATPAFGSHSTELPQTPRSRSKSPPILQRFRTHPPVAKSSEDTDKKSSPKEEKSRFSLLFSPAKDKDLCDQGEERYSPPLLNKSKRSSMEKKKEKLGKQRKEGLLGEEADADDEDSISGGRKPSKSRSIGEMIRGVKRSPPELKRTKSSEGRR